MNNLKFVFLGPQGSGKGTQAALLSDKFKIPHISTGDIFRMNKEKCNLDRKICEYIEKGLDKGELAPDEVVNSLVKARLDQKDCARGFILDGYPRNKNQKEFLENFFKIDYVIFINISEKETIKRLSNRRVCSRCGNSYNLISRPPKKDGLCDECGGKIEHREDDRPKAINKRLQIYRQETTPLLKDYDYQGILAVINGEVSIEEAHKEILEKIGK